MKKKGFTRQSFFSKNLGGFTIIELLVVISIIAILSGIVLIDYRSGQQALALQRATNKLAQDIRRVQEMAMSAIECGIVCDPTCSLAGVPPGGYGIFFLKIWDKSYNMFADLNDTKAWELFGTDCAISGNPIQIEGGIIIDDFSSDYLVLSIVFTSPDPDITICGGNGSNDRSCISNDDTGWIRLCIEGTDCSASNTKTININAVGRIEID